MEVFESKYLLGRRGRRGEAPFRIAGPMRRAMLVAKMSPKRERRSLGFFWLDSDGVEVDGERSGVEMNERRVNICEGGTKCEGLEESRSDSLCSPTKRIMCSPRFATFFSSRKFMT